ncbi:ammonium transporter [Neisseria sp. Ec49-e6-T10]|uniref:ammonium transporter n=1 Tax=Neisseria sp. Ec49-e6-T10 TaxID=3140744 RepID=UPI003EB7514A
MDMVTSVFIFFCTLLVWIMTPGIALFYGGLVRRKNVLSTAMHSFSALAIVSLLWIIVGYSLAFSGDGVFIGDLNNAFLHGVGFQGPEGSTIPPNLFMMFQLTFAIIATGILTGSIAERMYFPAFLVFIVGWLLFIYAPVAHWAWGHGWFERIGAIDFAGGTVVHITSGVAGLVLAIMLGHRKTNEPLAPHNLPLTIIGGILVWFGWYGFNVGSAGAFNEIAMVAFINTNTAAVSGIVGWVAIEWMLIKKPTMLGVISGALAGLVGITPAAGFVSTGASVIIGLIAGGVCFWAISSLKKRLKYDDALDAFGLHGVGGVWGSIATGLFASKQVNPAIENGLFYGNASMLGAQLVATLATFAYAAAVSFVLIILIKRVWPIRVDSEKEHLGLDASLHGERAYQD